MARRRFDGESVAELRAIALCDAVALLGLYASRDMSFVPVKDSRSERWLVSGEVGTFELIVTRDKWFDCRTRQGGGGAIDLTMHLLEVDFREAVRRLAVAARGDTARERARSTC